MIRFPLVIVIDKAEGGFLGLNLHYLPPILRAKFLDALLDITSNDKYDESTKFALVLLVIEKVVKVQIF